MNKLQEQAAKLKPTPASTMLHALWPLAVAIAIGLFMVLVVGRSVDPYKGNILINCGIAIILAVSLTVVNGFTGQFSMGHAGFMAVGGYTAAVIVYYSTMKIWGDADFHGGALSYTGAGSAEGAWFGWGDVLFVFGCLLAGTLAAIAGYLVGLPSLRLRGDYLAIVTLGFGEIVRVILQGSKDQIQPWKASEVADTPWYQLPLKLGGPKGFNLMPTYTTLFWVYLAVVLTLIIIYRLKVSSSGRAFLSIREDEVASQAMGVDITKYKVRAFVLSSFFAGVAGALFAMYNGTINAAELGFQKSFDIIIMVVLGGMGSISGAAIAAVILTILPEILRSPPHVWPWGLGLLAVMTGIQAFRRNWNTPSLIVVAVATTLLEIGRDVCLANSINPADYRLVLYALLLILMMILRPDGLFGVNEIWNLVRFGRPKQRPAPQLGEKP
ncbi:MAG TPA: branched-chain amino acid ABC transporter permease [Phycisphaerales bacterium]|nr:branched-chain amino acid ABC transporter permease [Phycisphaerales bacterium]